MRATVAVIDIGKTNAKVSAATETGHVVESASAENETVAGQPWRAHDLKRVRDFVLAEVAGLCRRHPIRHVVPSGHGSGAVLTLADPDASGDGAALPMIDYEDACPPEIDALYARLAGTFLDRGGRIMMASTHQARQMLRAEVEEPRAFARAAHALAVAPYWAWVLSGTAASEVSSLGAQSQLWNVANGAWSPIVAARGWGRLLPPLRPAWDGLGPIRPALAARYALPAGLRVHLGGHDSSLNLYRYQAAGLADFTLVSTGTWIVAMRPGHDPAALDEHRNMVLNADVFGRPVGGALTMGGREFRAIAGAERGEPVEADEIAAILAARTVALPTFGSDAGQFPGSEGRGRIEGGLPPGRPENRSLRALALLHVAMLTVSCAASLAGRGELVLDGKFLGEPLFAPLVAALMPGLRVTASTEPAGVSAGAALLARHAARAGDAVPVALSPVAPAEIPGLAGWADLWRSRAEARGTQ